MHLAVCPGTLHVGIPYFSEYYLKKINFFDISGYGGKSIERKYLMPSPSASSKFGSSILKFFKHAQFFMYTQNHFGILKS